MENKVISRFDLKSLRAKFGWCRTEMARHLGCSTEDVRRWEARGFYPLSLTGQLQRLMIQIEANSELLRRMPLSDKILRDDKLDQVEISRTVLLAA